MAIRKFVLTSMENLKFSGQNQFMRKELLTSLTLLKIVLKIVFHCGKANSLQMECML